MEKYIIHGGKKLRGEVEIKSAKNSVLALLAAALLSEKEIILKKTPNITDVGNMLAIIGGLGTKCRFSGDNLILDSSAAAGTEIPAERAKEIRSSIFLLGPMVSRFKKAVVPYPGGCNIGKRPIDLHLSGLRALGVKIEETGGYIICDGSAMKGGNVYFDYPSVGATENVMMAAVLTKGTTEIHNVAKEPEIVDLQNFINALGGRVSGAGTCHITVEGVKTLGGAEYLPIPDRIVAGTYLLTCLTAGGELAMKTNPDHIDSLISKFSDNACVIDRFSDKIIVKADSRLKSIGSIETEPYPGFPTDLQAQIMALLTVSEGTGVITENLFETRFKHIDEMRKMGADITADGRAATVRGVKKLHGAEVSSFDLRGGAAMVIAGLAAEGKTVVNGVRHIDRGYEDFEGVLTSLGAEIIRQKN